MIFEIRPVQFGWEQVPANLVRPFDITIFLPFLIGPYVLHFMQNPSIEVITLARRRICMNSLAKNMQISRLDPLLFDVNSGFIEGFLKYKIQKRCTADNLGEYQNLIDLQLRRQCRITTIMRQDGSLIFTLFELFKEFHLINFEYSNKWGPTHETFKRAMFRIEFFRNQFGNILHVLTRLVQ